MDVEAIMEKYERLIPAGAYTLGEGIRAAMNEAESCMAMEHNFKMLQVEANYEATVQNQAERIRQLEAKLVPSPSCRGCANRGRVNGLSQESYCDSCVWQGHSFRVNHYAPLPNEAEATGKYGLQVDAERVPEGWKLVPIEPTAEQIFAMDSFSEMCFEQFGRGADTDEFYRAGIAAAPQYAPSENTNEK